MSTNLSQSKQTVLVIDDEENVRYFLKVALNSLGYRMLTASSAKSGLSIYQRYQSEIALVLFDKNMPGMSGSELYKALRHRDPFVKCLMMSGDASPDEIEALKKVGLAGYLPKPFTLTTLANYLEGILADDIL